MKKRALVIIAFILSSLVLTNLVSAAFSAEELKTSANNLIEYTVNIFTPFFEVLIGNTGTSDSFFFAKILLLILLFIFINSILSFLPVFQDSSGRRRNGVIVLISFIVSLLAVRFISENQITTMILLPYGAMGIAMTSIIPFIVFFFFVHRMGFGSTGRRIAWIFFAIIFSVFWFTVYATNILPETGDTIYLITLIVMGLVFIFDRSIHVYFAQWELNPFYKNAHTRSIAAMQAQYVNLLQLDTPQARAARASLAHQITSLGGNVP